MNIQIQNNDASGVINVANAIKGKGILNHYSWCLSSTSSTLILEIAADPNITPDDLPLVGYGCAGWVHEGDITYNEKEILTFFEKSLLLFNENKLNYMLAVTCSCSDM